MAKLWKAVNRQRPFWPPAWDFVAVIALSIVLAAWPFFDPQWWYRGLYTFSVAALLIVASMASANQRWKLERRYAADLGSQLMSLRSKTWMMQERLGGIVYRYREAERLAQPLPSVNDEYTPCIAQVTGTLSELAHYGIFGSEKLKAVLNKNTKTAFDLAIMVSEIMPMNEKLNKLYVNTLLGD